MSVSKVPWVIKYRPKKLSEFVNQEEAVEKIKDWIKKWLSGKPEKKAALFYGPPGSGKTSIVEALCREYGFQLIEMNASDYRREQDIERVAKLASAQRGLFANRRIILLDEIDGLALAGGVDAGAIEAIMELIEVTKNPVIMTANNPWDLAFKTLRDHSVMIEFKRLSKRDVLEVLRRICAGEKLSCDEKALDFIAEKSEGDLRSAINDLEAVAEGGGEVTEKIAKQLLRARDRVLEPFEVVRRIFWSKYVWQAKLNATQTDLDPDTLMEWISENLPRQITDPEDLWRAYEALARADVYRGRIVKTGSWDLLAYTMELMTAGVALAPKNDLKSKFRWVKYQFPEKIRLMSQTKEARTLRDSIASIIGDHIHASRAKVLKDVLPYIKVIFENNVEVAAKIAISLNLTDSMIKYLSQSKGDEIITRVKELRKAIRAEARKTKLKKSETQKNTKKNEEIKKQQQVRNELDSFTKKTRF
ncbi:MAG: replication factor C large subunit [Desulfurococcaceae archaeon TW002]